MATVLQAAPQSGYRSVTQGQAISMLADRLEDKGNVFWSEDELWLYIAEALRTWQAYTSWYKTPVQLNPNAFLSQSTGAVWYDLSEIYGMGYTVTYGQMADMISYHLLEFPATSQFPYDVVQYAVQQRLNRFKADSGIVVDYMLQSVGLHEPVNWDVGMKWDDIPPVRWADSPGGRATLVDGLVDIRRVAHIDDLGVIRTLWRANEWDMNSFAYNWMTTPGPPKVYSTAATAPLLMQLAPPVQDGVLEILAITQGVQLTTRDVLLEIPDDFCWGVKWGALADLLSADGEAKDVARAQYCQARYQECVELAKSFPSIVNARSNKRTVWVGSVNELDSFASGWQNNPVTTAIGMAGRNLIAVSSVFGKIDFDIVPNYPLPQMPESPTIQPPSTVWGGAVWNSGFKWDTGKQWGHVAPVVLPPTPIPPLPQTYYLNVPPDVMHAVLGYAQHLASWKMGGDEFFATEQQRADFVALAAMWNSRLRQLNFFNESMRAPASKNLGPVQRIQTADNTAPGYGAGVRGTLQQPAPATQGQS